MKTRPRFRVNDVLSFVRSRPLELTLLLAAAGAMSVTIDATAAVALRDRAPRDLTFGDAADELSRMLSAGGTDRIGRLERARLMWGSDTAFVDTIRVATDSLAEPSFAKGGFLHDQVALYNDYAIRQAVVGARQRDGRMRAVSEGPSFFRSIWTDDGARRLSERPNPSALAIRSPYAEGGWREVRTADWSRNPGLLGYDGEVALRADTAAGEFRARINGRQCDVKRQPPKQLMYCRSTLASDASVFYDFGFELYPGPNGGAFSSAFPYRQRQIWMNGSSRVFGRQAVKGGDVFDVQWIGPFMLSSADWGTLAAEQWINGRPTFANEQLGTLSFFSRAGRSTPVQSASAAPLVLGFDATLARDLDRESRRFLAANERLLARLAVVVLDVRTGEIKAIAEPARTSNDEPLLSFEPLLVGSVVKPIVAAAVLTRQPSLADLRLSYAGDSVRSVSGIPLSIVFGNGANGCTGDIDFSAFLRCSSNQYAAELLIRSLQRDGFAASSRPGALVPRNVLEASSVATGLAEAFDVDAYAERNRGRLSLYWNAAGAATPDAVATTNDRSLVPWESRPWIIFPDSAGTRVDWLARYAFGGWENRWTLLGLAQAFSRIATDRNVQATFMHSSLAARSGPLFAPAPPAAASAFAKVRGALRQVANDGTAGGLADRLRATIKEPVVVLAKTGTLNEDAGKLKSLAIVVGRAARDDPSAPITCGLVAISYFEFFDTWTSRRGPASLPRVHLDFANGAFSEVIGRHWTRVSGCANPPPDRKLALSAPRVR
jgi:hypothetical protein